MAPDILRGPTKIEDIVTRFLVLDVNDEALGERQAEAYLPRGRFGKTSISYDGSFSERMIRLLISFISCFGTMTPVG